METSQTQPEAPKRLYFKTYLQLIQNSVGSEMFRNFYMQTPDGGEFDAMSDGDDSCAFYVSSVLTLFRKHFGVHGTVTATIADLHQSGWQKIEDGDMQAGDVIVWDAKELGDSTFEHLGFYVGDGRAVSTSSVEKRVVEHDVQFDGNRGVQQVFRHSDWEV